MGKGRASPHVAGENALLSALAPEERDRLRLERVSMAVRDAVYEPSGPIEHVYFPLSGVFSLIVVMSDTMSVEAAIVGNEGMVGLPVFLGANTSPHRAFCQIPGECLRTRAIDFRAEVARCGSLDAVMKRYNQALVNQMAYSVACNRLHSVEERMCRWLLMTQDRVGADRFPLTQEFLAQMLGVRQPNVTVTAAVLQNAGYIAYTRCHVVILNRSGLEESSCECYRVVRNEFVKLLGREG